MRVYLPSLEIKLTRPTTIDILATKFPPITKLLIAILATLTLLTPPIDPPVGDTVPDAPPLLIGLRAQSHDPTYSFVAADVDFGLEVWDRPPDEMQVGRTDARRFDPEEDLFSCRLRGLPLLHNEVVRALRDYHSGLGWWGTAHPLVLSNCSLENKSTSSASAL